MGETVEIDRPTTGQTDLLRSAGLDLPDLQQRYRVLAELDYGGMADVFLALQVGAEGLSRLAVVKRMRAEPGAQDESTRMFLNEARLVATLSHPHIVKIFDLGWVNSDIAMAMEYVDGESLHYVYRESKRRETPIPIRVILKLMVEAAEALHYAHSATASDGSPLQLIHRDIGLQNLLLTRSGYLKVIDFGVAKTKAQTDVTTPGLIKGKIQYFAPETLTRKDIDGRADLYALGLVLYELVTLSAAHPFPRDATLAEVYERITTYVLPPVSAMRDDAPAALDGVIRRATEIDRDARFATGAEFADALRAVANGLGGLASTTEVEEWFRASFALRLQERTEFERNAVARVDDVAPL
ncbi:MAG: serine/threonine-protein kinase, partial [Myxococcota bacterium]